MGRSFHQPGTVKENVLESDFEPLCDGTTRRLSLADLRLLEGIFYHVSHHIQNDPFNYETFVYTHVYSINI